MIAVASIDEFLATTLTINSSPSPITLPDNGILVHQDWSGDFRLADSRPT